MSIVFYDVINLAFAKRVRWNWLLKVRKVVV